MTRTKQLTGIAFCLLLLLVFRVAGEAMLSLSSGTETSSEWLIDLDREQDNRENRSAENNLHEEIFEHSVNIHFQHFAPICKTPAAEPARPLPFVVIDTSTPPPNFG